MPYTNTLKVFEKLRPAFDEKQSTAVAEAIELAVEENNETTFEKLSTKVELKEVEVRILRWMVTLWVTQMLATIAFFFKK